VNEESELENTVTIAREQGNPAPMNPQPLPELEIVITIDPADADSEKK
jgi:hypothetical protein